jgi:hypothetical protein
MLGWGLFCGKMGGRHIYHQRKIPSSNPSRCPESLMKTKHWPGSRATTNFSQLSHSHVSLLICTGDLSSSLPVPDLGGCNCIEKYRISNGTEVGTGMTSKRAIGCPHEDGGK